MHHCHTKTRDGREAETMQSRRSKAKAYVPPLSISSLFLWYRRLHRLASVLALLACLWWIFGSFFSGTVGYGGVNQTQVAQDCGWLDFQCNVTTTVQNEAELGLHSISNSTSDLFNSKDQLNIFFSTPPADTYLNSAVVALNGFFVGVVDASLAVLLTISG